MRNGSPVTPQCGQTKPSPQRTFSRYSAQAASPGKSLRQRQRKPQPRVLVDVHENQRGCIHTRSPLSGNRVQGIAPIASGFRPYSQTNTTLGGVCVDRKARLFKGGMGMYSDNHNLQAYNSPEVVAYYASASGLAPCEIYAYDNFIPRGAAILDIGVGGGAHNSLPLRQSRRLSWRGLLKFDGRSLPKEISEHRVSLRGRHKPRLDVGRNF